MVMYIEVISMSFTYTSDSGKPAAAEAKDVQRVASVNGSIDSLCAENLQPKGTVFICEWADAELLARIGNANAALVPHMAGSRYLAGGEGHGKPDIVHKQAHRLPGAAAGALGASPAGPAGRAGQRFLHDLLTLGAADGFVAEKVHYEGACEMVTLATLWLGHFRAAGGVKHKFGRLSFSMFPNGTARVAEALGAAFPEHKAKAAELAEEFYTAVWQGKFFSDNVFAAPTPQYNDGTGIVFVDKADSLGRADLFRALRNPRLTLLGVQILKLLGEQNEDQLAKLEAEDVPLAKQSKEVQAVVNAELAEALKLYQAGQHGAFGKKLKAIAEGLPPTMVDAKGKKTADWQLKRYVMLRQGILEITTMQLLPTRVFQLVEDPAQRVIPIQRGAALSFNSAGNRRVVDFAGGAAEGNIAKSTKQWTDDVFVEICRSFDSL